MSTTETRIVRLKQVMEMTGIHSKSTLYRWIKQGRFAAPVKIGPRCSGWYVHEIQEWIASAGTSRDA